MSRSARTAVLYIRKSESLLSSETTRTSLLSACEYITWRFGAYRLTITRAVVSHGRQGVAIAKAVKAHYAIIYSGSREPQPQPAELPKPGELGMKESIRMKLQSQRDQLDPMSRIHLMVSYPIHHNIEVYNMGMIHPDSLNVLFAAYLAVNFPGVSSS